MATFEPKIWRAVVLHANDSRRPVCEGFVLQEGIFSDLCRRQTTDSTGRVLLTYFIDYWSNLTCTLLKMKFNQLIYSILSLFESAALTRETCGEFNSNLKAYIAVCLQWKMSRGTSNRLCSLVSLLCIVSYRKQSSSGLIWSTYRIYLVAMQHFPILQSFYFNTGFEYLFSNYNQS